MAGGEETKELFLGSVQREVESLIAGRQIGDPRLYEAILLLNRQLESISRELSPLARQALDIEIGVSNLPAPTGFTAFTTKITVRFIWNQVTYASQYEVREGTDWDTATFKFRTIGLQGDIDALLYGTYNYLIKTVDSLGNYSADVGRTSITITEIGPVIITSSVIDNNVLLYWTEPFSLFKIDYYLLDKTGDGESAGRVDSTFTSVFEVVAGTYIYQIRAVDIAGNIGAPSEVEIQVNTPPDFALQDVRVSDLLGDRVNVLKLADRKALYACWRFPQTWQQHFSVYWDFINIKAQMDAGYPLYIQPTHLSGSYEEVIDYGLVIHNTIVTVTWNTYFWTPQFNMIVTVKMAVSNDGITYTPFTLGASQYFRDIRYLKLRLEFDAENDRTLIEIYNLTINLNVKRENDGGEVFADAGHAGGTVVNFLKPFRDIESITCTTKSDIEPYVVIFDFVDIPDPVSFRVFVFDTTGNRVSKTVDWKARGIV